MHSEQIAWHKSGPIRLNRPYWIDGITERNCILECFIVGISLWRAMLYTALPIAVQISSMLADNQAPRNPRTCTKSLRSPATLCNTLCKTGHVADRIAKGHAPTVLFNTSLLACPTNFLQYSQLP